MLREPIVPCVFQLARERRVVLAHPRYLIEQNYRSAVFYDTKQRNAVAAKTAYQKFLKEFPDSKYAKDVKKRLKALEHGAAPLRR